MSEYIKKEEALKALHDFWDECINFDGSGTELMLENEGVIDDLPTYSFPDSAENKGDLISKQAVINAIANTCFWLSADNWEELTECINSIPSVENKENDTWT